MSSLHSRNGIILLAASAALALSEVSLVGPDLLNLSDHNSSDTVCDRDAVLLECCDLPDKQLTVTEADLDGIVSRFTALSAASVPVKVEHLDTVFDPLGVVQRVWRDGRRLMGNLSFAPDLARFLRERGPVKLSCGLSRSPLSLAEVSLVLKPRVAAACLLSADDAAELVQLRKDNAAILARLNTERVDAQIVSLKLAGKIIPATEAAARVLLMANDHSQITLADGNSLAVAEAFLKYLDSQPPLITLGQLTQLSGITSEADGNGSTELTQDQREWLEKSLGVKSEDVAKMMDRDKGKMSQPAAAMGIKPRVTTTDTHRTTETRRGM